jgi:hypothetical protein
VSDDTARRLAEALSWVNFAGPWDRREGLARLLPVVEAIARERAAEELEAAADRHEADEPGCLSAEAQADRARAAALRGEAGR